MASDYRYNPFLNSLEPIAITGEIHVIPTNSPFTIRLHEVPLKEAPSTVSMTIGGIAGVEVAAEPAPGEFRCDYTTGADNDENWNTGLIQFNAADAGKTVVAAYNGMGSLASINAPSTIPTWAKYRGDGSDGDFVAAGGEILSGVKQYKSFTLGAGLTVNVGAEPLIIMCQGDVLIDGTLNGAGKQGGTGSNSASGGAGVGGGGNGGGSSGVDPAPGEKGTGGGAGGYGKANTTTIDTAGSYLNLFDKLLCAQGETPSSIWQSLMGCNSLHKAGGGGAGGEAYGAGGGGGGTIMLAGETVSNAGTLNIAGGAKSTSTGSNNNVSSGGGGGGASIVIIAKNIIISGVITVKGGDGGLCRNTAKSQNGGAGWYKIFTAG
jgi:hypothetical protein